MMFAMADSASDMPLLPVYVAATEPVFDRMNRVGML